MVASATGHRRVSRQVHGPPGAPRAVDLRTPDGTLLLDGPTGTEMHRRGVDTTLPLWSAQALIDAQDTLAAIHRDYVEAGADVLTANTFRTNGRTLRRAGMLDAMDELVAIAVSLARDAAEAVDRGVVVAGSLAPLEDCYRPDLTPDERHLAQEHTDHAKSQAAAGVDLLLVETHPTVREAALATAAARKTGLPVWTSVCCGADGRLLSGEHWPELVAALRPAPPDVLLVNCTGLPGTAAAMPRLRGAWDGPWGAYANVGTSDPVVGWEAGRDVAVGEYADAAAGWLRGGASVVGSCCGTGPEHTRALSALVGKTQARTS